MNLHVNIIIKSPIPEHSLESKQVSDRCYEGWEEIWTEMLKFKISREDYDSDMVVLF